MQSRNGEKTWIDISPGKRHKLPKDRWKNAQHHSSWVKSISKTEWEINSHPSESLKLTRKETDVGNDAGKGESSYSTGGNANWCSQSGKQYRPPLQPRNCTAIHPKDAKLVFRGGICTPMIIVEMSTVAKIWENLWCASTDDGIKKR